MRWERIATGDGWRMTLDPDFQLIITREKPLTATPYILMLDSANENSCGYVASTVHLSQAKHLGNIIGAACKMQIALADCMAELESEIERDPEASLMKAAVKSGEKAGAAFGRLKRKTSGPT